jgi:hypothetical protein
MVASITRIQSPLNFLMSQFWYPTVVPKYLNRATFSKHLLAVFMSWFCPAFWWRVSYMYMVFSAFTSRPISLLSLLASLKVYVFFFMVSMSLSCSKTPLLPCNPKVHYSFIRARKWALFWGYDSSPHPSFRISFNIIFSCKPMPLW